MTDPEPDTDLSNFPPPGQTTAWGIVRDGVYMDGVGPNIEPEPVEDDRPEGRRAAAARQARRAERPKQTHRP